MAGRHWLSMIAIVGPALLGCGSSPAPHDADQGGADAGGAGGTSSAPATALEACKQLDEAEAQLHARCLGGAIADWRAVASNGMDCTRYARHVGEGKVDYRPGAWTACLAKYNLPCEQANPYPCYFEILHGTVLDGQPCEDTDVCGVVSACINLSGATCGEICVRLGNENEACGFYCGSTTTCFDVPLCASGLTCVDNVCVKAKQANEACGGPQQIACRFGLGCDVDPSAADGRGTCVTLSHGQSCRSDGGCVATEFCLAGTCTPRRGAGEPCTDAPTSCGGFTACDGTGSCAVAGHPGQPCGRAGCAAGLCDGTLCQPVAGQGESCAAVACAPGTSCDPNTSLCQSCEP